MEIDRRYIRGRNAVLAVIMTVVTINQTKVK